MTLLQLDSTLKNTDREINGYSTLTHIEGLKKALFSLSQISFVNHASKISLISKDLIERGIWKPDPVWMSRHALWHPNYFRKSILGKYADTILHMHLNLLIKSCNIQSNLLKVYSYYKSVDSLIFILKGYMNGEPQITENPASNYLNADEINYLQRLMKETDILIFPYYYEETNTLNLYTVTKNKIFSMPTLDLTNYIGNNESLGLFNFNIYSYGSTISKFFESINNKSDFHILPIDEISQQINFSAVDISPEKGLQRFKLNTYRDMMSLTKNLSNSSIQFEQNLINEKIKILHL